MIYGVASGSGVRRDVNSRRLEQGEEAGEEVKEEGDTMETEEGGVAKGNQWK